MAGARTIPIRFADDDGVAVIAESLSALKGDGRCLWLAGDETVSLERVTLSASRDAFTDHVSFPVANFLRLPAAADSDGAVPEIDIEGIDRHGGYLWFVGSHSRTRKRVQPHHATEEALARLAKVGTNANRYLLGRIPVAVDADGLPTLVPADPAHELTAAALGLHKRTRLTTALDEDPHLGRFLKIPGKDNGFDVEGLAVVDERVYLGLRGPVLRGWAVVVELQIAASEGADLLIAPAWGHARYRKHFLDLGGLGIRDILAHGADLLLLAGPTMDLDGPVRVYRWREAVHTETSTVVTDEVIEKVIELPYGDGVDHAEGITLFPGDPSLLLIVHDSPAPFRRAHRNEILADVVRLPTGGFPLS